MTARSGVIQSEAVVQAEADVPRTAVAARIVMSFFNVVFKEQVTSRTSANYCLLNIIG
jgi:hypothetical protein